MTDLTEQLEKGELPEGWYYLKVNEELANYPVIAECVLISQFSYFYDFDEAKIEQVLAPVPGYEEWKAILRALEASHETIINEDKTINRLVHSGKQCNYENTKLKKLLKECRKWIGVERDFAVPNEKVILQQLLTEIDEVLE